MMKSVEYRNIEIDIIKIFAAIMIFMRHRATHLLNESSFVSMGITWIYVELFLFITGYYTTRHFAESTVPIEPEKNALIYTVRKFKRIIYYSFITVSIAYIIYLWWNKNNFNNIEWLFTVLEQMVIEISFLSHGFNISGIVTGFWYMSSSLLVFPIYVYSISKGECKNIYIYI